jgi:hypothetical protein
LREATPLKVVGHVQRAEFGVVAELPRQPIFAEGLE